MKTKEKYPLSLAIIVILLVFIGCKKTPEKNEPPVLFTGKFIFDTDYGTLYLMTSTGLKTLWVSKAGKWVNDVRWSPDGSMIRFHYGQTSYIINTDLTIVIEIPGKSIIWSADGTRIAYIQGDSIFTSDADGSDPCFLKEVENLRILENWSPDGSKIAFIKNDYSSIVSDSICIINSDGSGLMTLVQGNSSCWLPDGSELLFTSKNAAWSISLSDHSVRKWADLKEGAGNIEWSPDRTRLAYACDGNVYVINSRGGTSEKLTDDACAWAICWSSDGTRIAHIDCPAFRSLSVVDSDGSKETTIIDGLDVKVSSTDIDALINSFDWH